MPNAPFDAKRLRLLDLLCIITIIVENAFIFKTINFGINLSYIIVFSFPVSHMLQVFEFYKSIYQDRVWFWIQVIIEQTDCTQSIKC